MDLTIETLVQRLRDWVRRGLVDSQVWQDIQELISYDLPFVTVVESYSPPISAPTVSATKTNAVNDSTSLQSKIIENQHKQETILVGCVLLACADLLCFNSHTRSQHWWGAGGGGVLKRTSLNRFPILAILHETPLWT